MARVCCPGSPPPRASCNLAPRISHLGGRPCFGMPATHSRTQQGIHTFICARAVTSASTDEALLGQHSALLSCCTQARSLFAPCSLRYASDRVRGCPPFGAAERSRSLQPRRPRHKEARDWRAAGRGVKGTGGCHKQLCGCAPLGLQTLHATLVLSRALSATPCCDAVPFEEDDRDPKIWFLDHSYLEQMYRMFKKVNGKLLSLAAVTVCGSAWHEQVVRVSCSVRAARERVVGWYSTGPRLREADLDINDLVCNYCDNPLLVICEVQARDPCYLCHTYAAGSLCTPAGLLGTLCADAPN